jgi:hypothetical protein
LWLSSQVSLDASLHGNEVYAQPTPASQSTFGP